MSSKFWKKIPENLTALKNKKGRLKFNIQTAFVDLFDYFFTGSTSPTAF